MASTGGGGMGMGGGPDSAPGGSSSSSGTGNAPGEGMGANAFGGGGQASKDTSTIEGFRAALAKALGQVTQEQKDKAVEAQKNLAKNQESLTKKTGISVAKTTEQVSKEQELQNLIDNFDPKAKVKHNPHLESLEPGAYDANVSLDLDQQLDLGLINKFEYDSIKAQINQEMPIGKNYDLGIKNMPTIDPDVEDVDQETRMGAFRNISYGSFPSAVVDNGLLGAAIDDPQGTQKGLDAEQAARDAMESSRDVNKNVDIGIGPETPKDAFRNEESKRMGQTLEALDRDPSPEVASASLDDDPFGGTMAEKEREALALSFVNDVEKEYDRIMKETKAFSKERALALRNLNAIKSTNLFSKSYAIANPSAIRDMLAKAMALFSGLGPALTIAKAIESRAIKAGMFDRTTFDQMMSALDDPGAFGPLGNPLGTGGADQNTQEKKIRDILAVVEPWTKGLNKRQIEYYYDNEEELDWVRNLYEQMNKSASA